jgi:hypothetical protein
MKRMMMWVMVVVTAMATSGCQSPVVEVVAPPAVQAAACALLTKQPAATPYVKLVAEVFTEFSSGEPPTPVELQKALAQLPGSGLDPATATTVWAGAALAYAGLHRANLSEAERERLTDLLGAIGESLRAAAESCGAAGARGVVLSQAEVEPLAEAIEREFLKRKP